MSELIFGIVWLAITITTSILCIVVKPSLIIFFSLFYFIGIFLVVKGAKRLIKDKSTEKNGEICYGRIKEISPTGVTVNGNQQLKAKVYFYIPSLNKEEILDEVIGYSYNSYHEGEYVKLKYYNNDINILGKVDKNEVPQNVLNIYENKDGFNSYVVVQSSERLQPMDMPNNGSAYAWNNDNNNNNNSNGV